MNSSNFINILKKGLIGLILLSTSTMLGQTLDIEALFKQRKYEEVIATLENKNISQDLSFRDYFLLSRSYGRTKQFINGYVLTGEMIKKAKIEGDSINLLQAFNLKTEHLTDLSRIEEGAKFCDSITPFFKKDSKVYMSLCFKCGMLYHYNDENEKAYQSYKDITLKEYRNISLYTNNFAIILKKQAKYGEALLYLKKSLEIDKKKEKKYQADLNVNYGNIGEIYLEQRDWKQAKKYLDSAYSALISSSRLTSKMGLFESYFRLYNAQKNTNMAQAMLDSIYVTNERLLEDRVYEKIHALEAANNKEKFLIKKVKVVDNELNTSRDEILKGTLILLSILLLLLIIVFVLKYRNVQASYKDILDERRLSWTKLNPEYINNSFDVMKGMIDEKETKSIRYLSKFSKLLRLILESSRKSLIPIQEELKTIKLYIDLQQLETNKKIDFSIAESEHIADNEIYIPPMLVQPFVERAIVDIARENITAPSIAVKLDFENNILTASIHYNATFIREETSLTIKRTKKILKIFSKRLGVHSDLKIEYQYKEDKVTTYIKLILPYKNETYD